MPGNAPLGVLSTITALGETQLPPPRPAIHLERPSASGGRYTVVGTLGRGGMGIVDRVWDGDLMRDLAVKRIRPEHRDDPRLVAQFMWEARVGAYLDHPNIVPVHDLGVTPEGPFFTMKRARGRSLAEWLVDLERGDVRVAEQLPLVRRLRVMYQVCQAIAFAHRRGVLHRDLKPANVLLGEDGEVLVTDWGLALPVPGKAGDEIRAVMPPGVGELSAGTPLYMSPEQGRGEPLDERSDVFTLGVMLYEVASLQRPVDPDRAARRLLREVSPEAPRSLAAVIDRATAERPEDRYATAAALAADVEEVIDGHTPSAERASPGTRLARFYLSRDRAMSQMRVVDIDMWAGAAWFAGIATGAGLAATIGGWWWATLVIALIMAVPPTRRYLALRHGRAA